MSTLLVGSIFEHTKLTATGIFATVGGFIFGYDIGVISGILVMKPLYATYPKVIKHLLTF